VLPLFKSCIKMIHIQMENYSNYPSPTPSKLLSKHPN
jgi:hypothetical protein